MGQKRVQHIDLIRIYLIIALIMCHAFAPFNGSWAPISDLKIPAYKWIARISYASLLETFVLISGFLFYKKLSRNISLITLIKDKLKRLYLPALVFGILYVLILKIPINLNTIIRILYGIGNLWFLPMLFWVFILYWFTYKYISNKFILTVILGCLAVLPYPALPFQINDSFYYLFFFHIGCIIAGTSKIDKTLDRSITVLLLFILYIIIFIAAFYIRDTYIHIHDGLPIFKKAMLICAKHVTRFSYSFVGVFLIYSFFLTLGKHLKKDVAIIANLCFGVYLVHEMILRVIYYKSNIIDTINIIYLPWVSVMFTLLLSVVIIQCIKFFKFSHYIL